MINLRTIQPTIRNLSFFGLDLLVIEIFFYAYFAMKPGIHNYIPYTLKKDVPLL